MNDFYKGVACILSAALAGSLVAAGLFQFIDLVVPDDLKGSMLAVTSQSD